MKVFIIIFIASIAVQHLWADDLYLQSGILVRNCAVKDTIGNKLIIITSEGEKSFLLSVITQIVSSAYDTGEKTQYIDLYLLESKVDENDFNIQVTTVVGDRYLCSFVSSTESTVTYRTRSGILVLNKNQILTVSKANGPVNAYQSANRVTVKEYKNLPLLLLAIGGGVGTYVLLKNASDYSDQADAYRLLNISTKEKEFRNKSDSNTLYGVGVGIVSLVAFFVSITPDEHIVEQPLSIFPTKDGLVLSLNF